MRFTWSDEMIPLEMTFRHKRSDIPRGPEIRSRNVYLSHSGKEALCATCFADCKVREGYILMYLTTQLQRTAYSSTASAEMITPLGERDSGRHASTHSGTGPFFPFFLWDLRFSAHAQPVLYVFTQVITALERRVHTPFTLQT